MKKLLKIIICLLCICCLLAYSIPVNAVDIYNENDIPNGFTQIYVSNISNNVDVYENDSTGEKCAIFNPCDFTEGDTIVLYNDEETGDKVQITVISQEPSISTCDSYDSGWSAGYIPSGFGTYTAEMDTLFVDLSYVVDVTAYPVKMLSIYNVAMESWLYHTNSLESYIGRSSAGAAPAYATCEFIVTAEQLGIIGGSLAGYLTLQINSSGQCRAMWGF